MKPKVYIYKGRPDVNFHLSHKFSEVRSICKADIVLAIGGDGTLIRAFSAMMTKNCIDTPLFGVNRGTVGFLSNDLIDKKVNVFINKLLDPNEKKLKRFIKKANVLKVYVNNKSKLALNEVAVLSKTPGKMLHTNLSICSNHSEARHISYGSDGLIVATSTGSTAYNLSAGGPILVPELDANVITPVAPYSLSSRPIVFPLNYSFVIKVKNEGAKGVAVVDGVKIGAQINTPVYIETLDKRINIIRVFEFFKAIEGKLNWNHNIKS